MKREGTPKRGVVALMTFAVPWGFGPYSSQIRALSRFLVKDFMVIWFALGYQRTTMQVGAPNLPVDVGILGGGVKPGTVVYMSQLNAQLSKHNVDAVVSLLDLNRLFVDEPLAPLSIAWFPNHFASLDIHSRHALAAFDVVCPLAPSDRELISAQLPHKRVVHVPHVVEASPSALSKAALRARHGVPPSSSFVVVMSWANYDTLNRKGVDTAILAFRELHSTDPGAFLIVRAVEINATKNQPTATALPIRNMLVASGLPPHSYLLHSDELPHEEALGFLQMADVLLHPSKSEGFGMHVLEAQALGTPAITTAFGAMADFTFHGVSVPPHAHGEWLSMGFVASPNTSGVVEALKAVRGGRLPAGSREEAKRRIREDMSEDAVGEAMARLIAGRKRRFPGETHAVRRYGAAAPTDDPSWVAEWTVVRDSSHALDADAIRQATESCEAGGGGGAGGGDGAGGGGGEDGTAIDDGAEGAVLFFQVLENDNTLYPPLQGPAVPERAYERPPLVAVRTTLLKETLQQGASHGIKAEYLLAGAVHHLLSRPGGTRAARNVGYGAVRVPARPPLDTRNLHMN